MAKLGHHEDHKEIIATTRPKGQYRYRLNYDTRSGLGWLRVRHTRVERGARGPSESTRERIRTPRSICTGLDEHPPFDILGDVVV